MKLLLCKNCGDVFSISTQKEKTCSCGKTTGMYTDNLNAWYTGDFAVPIGFANTDFNFALRVQPQSGIGQTFTAFIIPKVCETFKKVG